MTVLTNLYIIRCSLNSEVMNYLVTVLKTHETLSSLCLFDNLLCDNFLNLFKAIKISKNLTSFLVFEKSLPDDTILSENLALKNVLLVSANKLLAQGAVDIKY